MQVLASRVSEGHPLQRRRPLSVFLRFINAKSRPAGTGSSGLRGIYGAGVLDRCMELEAMYRKGWQDAEKLVQWYRAAKAEA